MKTALAGFPFCHRHRAIQSFALVSAENVRGAVSGNILFFDQPRSEPSPVGRHEAPIRCQTPGCRGDIPDEESRKANETGERQELREAVFDRSVNVTMRAE